MTICAYTFAKLNLLSNRTVSFSDTLQPFVHGLPLKGCKADWNKEGRCGQRDWGLFFRDFGQVTKPETQLPLLHNQVILSPRVVKIQ